MASENQNKEDAADNGSSAPKQEQGDNVEKKEQPKEKD